MGVPHPVQGPGVGTRGRQGRAAAAGKKWPGCACRMGVGWCIIGGGGERAPPPNHARAPTDAHTHKVPCATGGVHLRARGAPRTGVPQAATRWRGDGGMLGGCLVHIRGCRRPPPSTAHAQGRYGLGWHPRVHRGEALGVSWAGGGRPQKGVRKGGRGGGRGGVQGGAPAAHPRNHTPSTTHQKGVSSGGWAWVGCGARGGARGVAKREGWGARSVGQTGVVRGG